MMQNVSLKKYLITVFTFVILLLNGNCFSQNHWGGTWATAVQEVEAKLMPKEFQLLNDITIRQTARVSAGGDTLRVRLSNTFADWQDNLEIQKASVAVSLDNSSILTDTLCELTFSEKSSFVVPYGTIIVSDPLNFDLKPGSDIAVTLHITKSPKRITGHRSGRGEVSFMQAGDAVFNENLSSSVSNTCWYFLCGIDILSSKQNASIVCLGDSITDGKGSTEGENRRWPDLLAQRLQTNHKTSGIGVLNQGIGGNCLLNGGIGQSALQRIERDVLSQPAAKWVIILEGINDLGGGKTSEKDIIMAMEQIAYRSQSCGMKVIGSTILPCGNSFYYNEKLEEKRQIINQWIRTSEVFDYVIDWDAAIRNPDNHSQLLQKADSGDHLHLSDTGYQMLADTIDISIFETQ